MCLINNQIKKKIKELLEKALVYSFDIHMAVIFKLTRNKTASTYPHLFLL